MVFDIVYFLRLVRVTRRERAAPQFSETGYVGPRGKIAAPKMKVYVLFVKLIYLLEVISTGDVTIKSKNRGKGSMWWYVILITLTPSTCLIHSDVAYRIHQPVNLSIKSF